jgi:hypothetical protein
MESIWKYRNTEGVVVVTSIGSGDFLEDYRRNLEKFGHLDEVAVYVVVDNKTPAAFKEKAQELEKRGFRVAVPGIQEQKAYEKRLGIPEGMILENSDHRRNLGYLAAYESGAKYMISIDDDNYPEDDIDFYASHKNSLGVHAHIDEVSSSSAFFNICELMEFEPAGAVYPRGFPYYARHVNKSVQYSTKQEIKVGINAGLWSIDPDVDAISRLVDPRKAIRLTGFPMVLAADTWTPLNSQNTSMLREVIPSYYFVQMGSNVEGLKIDRYGDIFQGYFAEACSKALDIAIRAGNPITVHKRNAHNYFRDAYQEYACIVFLEELLPWLTSDANIEGDNYGNAYDALIDSIEAFAEKQSSGLFAAGFKSFLLSTTLQMREWSKACRVISGTANSA